jgi:hypothetical protein
LFFGILILTWVASGLLSMNPWGALEGATARDEAYGLRGSGVTWPEIRTITDQLPLSSLPAGQVRLDIIPLEIRHYVTSHNKHGTSMRFDAVNLAPAPMTRQNWARIPGLLSPGTGVITAGLIDDEDNYYYSHHNDDKVLPVYRVILDDDEHTRYYLDAVNGSVVMKVGQEGRWYRWLFSAPHRGDLAFLRQRPLWDIVMIFLMLGVTTGCITGAYMGFRRLTR